MNVKELREKHGLSQQELSDQTGIPKGRINGWEQKGTKPKAEDSKVLNAFFEKLENKGFHVEPQLANKKVIDLDVWQELKINNEEIRKSNATFKQEIEKLWSERDKFWALIEKLTPVPEPRKAQKG
jgi:transcriptional regulator with XRE-family HTH domain